jgi:DNA repair photolyase
MAQTALAGDSLSVYYGEFLVSPVPLELSFNWCSHGCRMCFANLNKPGRWADIKRTKNLLAQFASRRSFEAVLLKLGYPVLVSNRTDPFAASNFQQSVPLLEEMAQLGIPVAIQTRGGRGIDDVLAFLPPSVWYVSITTLDDDLRRRLEPGSTTVQSRFALIETLVSRGHRVVLGLNPLVPEWCPDPVAILRRARDAGCEGAWIELLHFNYLQTRRLSPRDREALTEPIIARAGRRSPDPALFDFVTRAADAARGCGLAPFSINQPQPSDFFRPYQQLYPRLFPTTQDFVNFCFEAMGDGEIFEFALWADFLLAQLPEGTFPLGHYVGAKAHQIMRTHHVPNQMTFRQLLALIWSDPRMKCCPANIRCFAYAGELQDDGWNPLQDDDGLPLMVFNRQGSNDYFVEVQ